jgi:threonine aldolase
MTLGVTKNGGLMCDAVLIFSEVLRDEPWRRLKRAGGVFSKMRYVSSQLLGYVEDGMWLKRASHANGLASCVGEAMSKHDGCELLYPVEGNMIFVSLSDDVVKSMEERVDLREMSLADTRIGGREGVYRFVLSWNTRDEEVDTVLGCLR